MNIGSIGSTNFYMPQMSGIRNRAMSAPMSGPMAQGAATGQGPDPGQMFAKVDSDGSGGLDQTEFQMLADKISEVTGDTVDVDELFETYDTDQDGVLNEEETQTAMEANRPEPPPPPGGMMGGMQGGPPPDPSQIFNDADTDGDGSLDESEAQSLVDMINGATGQEMDVDNLLEAYDADQDGVLNEEETQTAMEANRPEGPPPPAGGRPEESEGSGPAVSAGIENYMKMAVLGFAQDQATNTSAMFGGNPGAGGTASFYGVNTRA